MIFRVISLVISVITLSVLAFGIPQARADSVAWRDADDNAAIMQEFINAVTYVEYKYGTGPIVVSTEWLAAGVYAKAGGNEIIVNKSWSTGDYAALDAAIAKNVAAGFHNGGCNPIHLIALHESAHIIDENRGLVGRAILDHAATGKDLRPYLAGYSFDAYGSLDPGEALAEAFQAVECGTADAVEVELYRMLVGA